MNSSSARHSVVLEDAETPAVTLPICDREEEAPGISESRDDGISLNCSQRLQPEIVVNMNGQGSLLKVGTWNVRSLYQAGKLVNCTQEMSRLNIDILGVAETRWTDSGVIDGEDHTIYFSGGRKHQHGVGVIVKKHLNTSVLGYIAKSERVIMLKLEGKPFNVVIIQVYAPTADHNNEEVEEFYQQVSECLEEVKSTDVLVVMGDFNAKVGTEATEVSGQFGLGEKNERGERLIQFCQEEKLIVTNTMFQHPMKNLYTWSSPGDLYRNQIDYVLVRERFRNNVKNVKTYPGADINSDHCLLLAKLRIKIKKVRKSTKTIKYNIDLLKERDYKTRFSVEVKNQFDVLMTEDIPQVEDDTLEIEREWECLKNGIKEAERKVLPKKSKKKDKEWMTNEILDLMEERRNNKQNTPEYKRINAVIQSKCKRRKEQWYNDRCAEIEELEKEHRMTEMHDKVRLLTDRKRNIKTSNECVRDKDGRLLFDKDDVAKRWVEYIKELYDEPEREGMVLQEKESGPDILKEEVELAIKRLKTGKAGGIDGVLIEHFKALDDDAIEIVVKICKDIYRTGHLPEDLKHSSFIKIPKKSDAQECSDHRTISLMSHMIKIILKIILTRIERKIEDEIAESQSGFREGVGTREGIINLRLIIDKYLEAQKNIYICFIDYSKAFDCVKHEKLIRCLEKLQIDKNDIQLLYNLYWTQKASIQLKDGPSDSFDIKRGVRQGCVVSPKLFNLYTEEIFRKADELPGINIGGHNVTNLRYADDTALLAESEEKLQAIVNIVSEESEDRGLYMNVKKTKTMVVSRSANMKINIAVNGAILEQVKAFKYLGQTIAENGSTDTEIRKRIEIARKSFVNMSDVLTSKSLKIETRKRMARCYVLSTFLYASETWTCNKLMMDKIEAFEMWMLRRMLKISYTEHVTNVEVLNRAKESKPKLRRTVAQRKAKYFGHLVRRNRLQKVLIAGKVEGRRRRGRPRKTWLSDVTQWTGLNLAECVTRAEERHYWRRLSTNLPSLQQ